MGVTMKSMPAECRPYEKCAALGADALSDQELLAAILKCGTRERNAVELSGDLLSLAGGRLYGLSSLSAADLMSVPGIGPVKSVQLECIFALARRIFKSEKTRPKRLNDLSLVADYYMEDMRAKESEEVTVLFLDTKCGLISERTVSVGTVNSSLMPVREIMSQALRANAVSLILMHNHPSGDPAPSADDIAATKRVREAASLLGLTLLDHIVFGDRCCISLRDEGYIQ